MAALGLQQNETHNYILSQLKSALACLKECHTEEQRQQYRLAVTLVAPNFDDRMQERVADALELNRNRATFRDSVTKRTEINKQIQIKDTPLRIGDTVLCRHGQGTLIDYTPECKETNRADGACCVRITHKGYSFDQKFPSSTKGNGGARLQRLPISFAHDERLRRVDAVNDELLKKVSFDYNCDLCVMCKR